MKQDREADFLEGLDLMTEEHAAWRLIMKAWEEARRLSRGDPNDPKNIKLFSAIRLWGERLHALRASQDRHTVSHASIHAQECWEAFE